MNQREPAPADADDFRWQALFQRSTDPVFVLSRRRRVLFVNRAWEALTGVPLAQARGLICRRQRPAAPGDPAEEILAHALCPPPQVLNGVTAAVWRLLPASPQTGGVPRWWDVEFVPLREGDAVCGVLGRVTPLLPAAAPSAPPPELLFALRQRAADRWAMEWLASEVPTMRRLAEQVRLAASVRSPALLVGEAGSGKESAARLIHYHGQWRERAFVALDCARLPAAAVAELLFRPETEAHRRTIGTVYLHEPQQLPPRLQREFVALLTAGGAPRMLAGICNPSEQTTQRLQPELSCALSILVLRVPPLRERRADLPQLVERFLRRAAPLAEAPSAGLTPAAWELLRAYQWPGNLSELYATLVSARAAAGAGPIDAVHFPGALRSPHRRPDEPAREAERPLPLDQLLEEAERRLIQLALKRAKGKKARAAELLGVWRPRLLRRMIALGLAEAEPLVELELDEDE